MLQQKKWVFSGLCLALLVSVIAGQLFSIPEKNFELMQRPVSQEYFQLSRGSAHTPLTIQDLKDHWTLVAVGYTSCPDICPLTLSHLREIYPILTEKLPNFQVLFISVDPQRDTSNKLQEYLRFFHPEFLWASASHDILYPLTQELGLHYAITSDADRNSHYYVDHSTSLALINPQGEVRARFTPKDPSQDTRVPLEELLKGIEEVI